MRSNFAVIYNAKKATAPPLLFSLRGQYRYVPDGSGYGTLYIPKEPSAMARLDGQHRMEATQDFEEELTFQIYHGLGKEEEISTFTIINDNQKGLTKSLVAKHRATLLGAALEEREPHLAIAKKLNDDPDSVWHKKIDMGGEKLKTQGTKRSVTLQTMQTAVQTLISNSRTKSVPFKDKYEAVKNYWAAVIATFPDAWKDPRKHLLTKGIGVHSVCGVGRDLLGESFADSDTSRKAFEKRLEPLKGFDWGNKTSPFAYFSGQKGVGAATDLVNKVVYGSIKVDSLWDELKKMGLAQEDA
jgi:DGQHR domain-containing protein